MYYKLGPQPLISNSMKPHFIINSIPTCLYIYMVDVTMVHNGVKKSNTQVGHSIRVCAPHATERYLFKGYLSSTHELKAPYNYLIL